MLDKCIKLDGAAGPLRRHTNRYASNGTLRIAYELQGTMCRRRPWLVLIQGMGFDRSGWDPVLSALRRHFRLVLVDNRGTGRSDRPDGSFTVADMAGGVAAVLDAAGVGQAHVFGASLGGMVAQELAITWPERVGRLVLACTTPGWPAAYPMPAASLRLIMATRGMPLEAARRRHTEHALSAQVMQENPALKIFNYGGYRACGRAWPQRVSRRAARPIPYPLVPLFTGAVNWWLNAALGKAGPGAWLQSGAEICCRLSCGRRYALASPVLQVPARARGGPFRHWVDRFWPVRVLGVYDAERAPGTGLPARGG